MASVDVLDQNKKSVGKVDLPDAVFGVEVKPHLFWEVVRQQRANARAGTHSTKKRGDVSGGGKKPYRQKGTGNARHGSTREPQMRHGGNVFGPLPRDYSFHVPKKVRRAALRGALSMRLKDGQLTVAKAPELDAPKTKTFAAFLDGLGMEGPTLIISKDKNDVLAKSSRNIPYVKVLPVAGLNVYDLLRYDNLVILQDAVDGINARLGAK